MGRPLNSSFWGASFPDPESAAPVARLLSWVFCPGKGAWLNTCVVPSTQNPCKRTEDPCTEEQLRAQLVWRTAGGAHRRGLGAPAPLPGPISPCYPSPHPACSSQSSRLFLKTSLWSHAPSQLLPAFPRPLTGNPLRAWSLATLSSPLPSLGPHPALPTPLQGDWSPVTPCGRSSHLCSTLVGAAAPSWAPPLCNPSA